jgi:LPXTG-motif cell wall-anchored protein
MRLEARRVLGILGSTVLLGALGSQAAPAASAAAATSTPTRLVQGGPAEGPPLDPPPPATPTGHFHTWTGTPSDIAGGIVYSPGEVIVTHAPFADHGADTNPLDASPGEHYTLLQGANSAKGAAGDYAYPADADPAHPVYGKNAANIVEVRLAADATATYLLVRLNMMNDPRVTAIESHLDSHVLVVHGQQGAIDGHPVDVAADTAQSLFEVRIPRTAYDPGTGTHKVFVGAGLWDTKANTWYYPSAGNSPFYDIAYVPAEGMSSYWHDAQQSADIAAKSFDKDAFAVDFGALARGGCPDGMACPSYSGPQQGLILRTFRSGQPLGRGVTLQTRWAQDQGGLGYQLYRSPYQPYSLYVPQHPTGAIVFLLHFLGGNHMSYELTSMPQLADWAEQLGVTVIMPLGRGEAGWYESEAEKDFFEVWRDFGSHYRWDPDRVYLTGMSMGGYGTWRLGQLYPDLFARAIVWSGPLTPSAVWVGPTPAMYPQQSPPACNRDSAGCGYNLEDLFGNTRNVPYFVVHGGMDELVPSTGALSWMSQYAGVGGATYRFAFYPTHRHETSYPGTTEHFLLDWLKGLPPRQVNPTHVSYILQRRFEQPDLGGFRYQGAYWVSGLTLAPGASQGVVDADRATSPDQITDLGTQPGVDSLGPYRLTGADVAPAAVSQNQVALHLSGFAAATLATDRMGWDMSAPQHVTGKTDTATDLTLTGEYASDTVVRGAAFTRSSQGVVLHLPSGAFDVTLMGGDVAALPWGPRSATSAAATLPNTGSASRGSQGVIAIAVVLGMLGFGASRRRRSRG